MASNIKFKRSAVQNRVPTTAQLDLGELALNTYDGKLYTEINTGSAAVVEIGSKLSSLVVDGANGAGGGDVVFHGTTSGYDLTWDYSANTLIFNDNAKAAFGTDTGLQIYHTGSSSFIQQTTSGKPLHIKNDGDLVKITGNNRVEIFDNLIRLRTRDASEMFLVATRNSSVDLYYDNNLRFNTTDDGADVSGTGSLKLPVGTTAQRNSSPAAGDIRYNSTLGSFEGYSTSWGELGGGGIGIGSTSTNPASGVVVNRIGVGFTDINVVGSGISVTGYGSTIVLDFNDFKPGSFHRTIHNYTATAGQTTFTGLSYDNSQKQIAVYLNGARLSEATYTATSGTTVVLDVGASVGDEVEIINIHINSDVDRKVNNYTATAGQTTFTGLSYNSSTELDVYLNGIRLASADYTATSGNTVVLAVGASVNDVVDIVSTGDGVSFRSTADTSGDKFTLTNVGIGTDITPDKLNVRGNVNVVGVLTATTLHGDGSNLTNTGSTLSEPSSGTQRLVTTSLTTGTMTSSGTGSELAFDYSNNHLEFSDNTRATFGTGNDLQIYHTGSHTFFENSTGHTCFRAGGGQFQFQPVSGEKAIYMYPNGAVELYHDNSKKLETNSVGIDVTGTTTDDGARHDGDVYFIGGTSGRNAVWDMSDNALEFADNAIAKFGSSDDLEIFHDGGTLNFIRSNNGKLVLRSDTFQFGTQDGAHRYIDIPDDEQGVSLFYDNNKKLETTNTGATLTGTLISDGLTLGDSEKLLIGNNTDLELFHNGTNSIIQSDTGDLQINAGNSAGNVEINVNNSVNNNTRETSAKFIKNGAVELYYDNTKRFETTNTGASITGNLAVSGVLTYEDVTSIDAVGIVTAQQGIHVTSGNIEMQTAGNIVLGDSGGTSDDRLVFGASSDLQIYHNGNESKIEETGTGGLRINSSRLMINNGDQSETMADFSADGAVELYHNNSKKLETISGGVQVTGEVYADGVRVGDDEQIRFGTDQDLRLYHSGSHAILNNTTGSFQVQDAGTEKFRVSGTGTFFKDDITLSNDNDKLNFGAGNDLQIYSDGAAGYIDHVTTGTGADLILRSKTFVVRNLSNENMIVGNQNGAVLLYHDNTNTFSTTSFGAQTVFSSTNGDVSIFKVLHGNLSQGIGLGYNTILSTGSNADITLTLQSKGANPVNINTSGGEAMASFTPNGAAQLYHNNTMTTRTTSYGAEIFFSSSGGNVPILKVAHSNATQGVGIGYDSIQSTGSNANIPLNIRSKGSSNIQLSTSTEELMARFTPNGATELYYNNSKKLETDGNGIHVTTNVHLPDSGVLELGTDSDFQIFSTGSESHIKNVNNQGIIFSTNNGERWGIEGGGHFKPHANNAYDLGHPSYRIRNIYVNDLQLSNEAKKDTGGNDVDGTWGDWTLQEGEEEVFMINNRTGKKYAMMLREVK